MAVLLPDLPTSLKVCLVCDDASVEAAVRVSCPPPHQVDAYARQGLLSAHGTISEHGLLVERCAADADVVLVEWALDEAPALNTLCYHVRRGLAAPVFMLCREGPEAMAPSIAAGADDALTFPLHLPYLLAKVLAYRRLVLATRQASADPSAPTPEPAGGHPREVRHFGDLRLDLSAHRFFVREVEVELTPREFALLTHLIEHGEALCTRDQILDAVWGINFDTGTNMVDVYMYFLRKKLEAHGLKDMIETVRGHGYRLVRLAPPAG